MKLTAQRANPAKALNIFISAGEKRRCGVVMGRQLFSYEPQQSSGDWENLHAACLSGHDRYFSMLYVDGAPGQTCDVAKLLAQVEPGQDQTFPFCALGCREQLLE